MDLGAYLDAARAFDAAFRGRWEPVAAAPAAEVDPERLAAAWAEYTGRLQNNYPFFHPRYAGQMLKPPHPVAMAGYLAAMTVNPNNHALDGGPATGAMEKEVVGDLAAMFGLPGDTLGHLTSSGTIANLEALWVARQLAPGRAVAHSQEAHYTHARMCEVLGVESVAVPADAVPALFGQIAPARVAAPNPSLTFRIEISFTAEDLESVGVNSADVAYGAIQRLLFVQANVVSVVTRSEEVPEITQAFVADRSRVSVVEVNYPLVFGEMEVHAATERIAGVDVVVVLGRSYLEEHGAAGASDISLPTDTAGDTVADEGSG